MKARLSAHLALGLAAVLTAGSVSGCGGAGAAVVPETIYYNGKIVTINQKSDIVQALAVADGKIVAVGSDRAVRKLATGSTVQVDLKGKTMIPGFNDNHIHVGSAPSESQNWERLDKFEDLAAAIKARAAEVPAGAWIEGNLTRPYWTNDKTPDRWKLDSVVADHPVVLERGHLMMLNSLALQKAGITRNTKNPDGGWIIRDSKGEPTGKLFEEPAKRIVGRVMPKPPPLDREGRLQKLRGFLSELTRLGYTSMNVPGVFVPELPFLQEAYARWGTEFPRMTTQIRLSPGFDVYDDPEKGVVEEIKKLEGLGFRTGMGDDRFKLGAIKMSVDGGLSAPDFWTIDAYDNTTGWRKGMEEFHGVVRIPENVLYRVGKRADALGWQLGIHAIGDGAVQMSVNVLERIMKENPRPDARHYIHHFSVNPPEATLKKVADLGIIVSSQPAFVWYLGPFAVEVLQGEKEQSNNPQQSLVKRGIRLSYGSDGAPTDPRAQIWSAVVRKGWDGKVYGPDEKVPVMDAIRYHTLGTAYMNFDENKKGSLEVGKFADMVVLGEDILTIDPDKIKDIPIERTIIGGKEVFNAAQPQAPADR